MAQSQNEANGKSIKEMWDDVARNFHLSSVFKKRRI